MSALAEVYGTAAPTLTATQIAKRRGIPSPFVAKLMTTLALRGLVAGTRGPGGGYCLTRPPASISLLDIALSFQRLKEAECPLGRSQVCANTAACALHQPLQEFHDHVRRFLADTTLAGFAPAFGSQAAPAEGRPRKLARRRNG
jgi:Rrf2 family iron-sulfur cluster assembly transcriptional regulator